MSCFSSKSGSIMAAAQVLAAVPAGATAAVVRDGWIYNGSSASQEVTVTITINGIPAARVLDIASGSTWEWENRTALQSSDKVEAKITAEPADAIRPTFCVNTLSYNV